MIMLHENTNLNCSKMKIAPVFSLCFPPFIISRLVIAVLSVLVIPIISKAVKQAAKVLQVYGFSQCTVRIPRKKEIGLFSPEMPNFCCNFAICRKLP